MRPTAAGPRKGRRAPASPREGGFSLLEVMIALGVIAVALFAILSMILHTLNAKESMRQLELAKEAAATKVEEIKAQSFTAIYPTYNSVTFPVPGLTNPAYAAGNYQGMGTISIDNSNANLLDVQVTVAWKGTQGARTYTMRNLFTR